MKAFRGAILDHFPEIVAIVNKLPDGPYSPAQIREAIDAYFAIKAEQDPAYGRWKTTNTPGKTMFSVSPPKESVDVPDGRVPVPTKESAFELLLHELGDHVERAVQGRKLGDDKTGATGLPLSVIFEEQLGVSMEYVLHGNMPEKSRDRYVDIALALGAVDGVILTRQELIEFYVSRQEARDAAKVKTPTWLGQLTTKVVLRLGIGKAKRARAEQAAQKKADETLKSAKAHTNRIFRGGHGMPVRDEKGRVVSQPVLTNDLMYAGDKFDTFMKSLPPKANMKKVVTYLLSAKHDPTEPIHVDYMADKHGILPDFL